MSTQSETWLPVPGYESFYEVSDAGQVRSLPRPRTAGGVLRQMRIKGDYRQVTFCRDGKQKNFLVHVAVAAAFHGPRPAGLVIRHLDGDPSNNSATNLRYGTDVENARDLIRHGRHNQLNKTHCPQGHPFDEVNTSHVADGSRACRKCRAEQARAYRLRKKVTK